jgi:poly-beta-hydroxyalkanoate depolymerase
MNTEWAQKSMKVRVMKHIQGDVRKAYKAFLAHDRILSMNKSHKRYWQINKAYRLSQLKVEIVLPCEIHQIATTIELE